MSCIQQDRNIENTVRAGIQRALTRLGVQYGSVTVDIGIKRGEPLETLAEREPFADLPTETLRQLLHAGIISDTEFAEATMEKQNTDEE